MDTTAFGTAPGLNTIGFANDGANNDYQVERPALPVTTTWTKFIIPIPDAAKLGMNDGVIHFADDTSTAYTLWIDDVQFETVDPSTLGTVAPAMQTITNSNFSVGSTLTIAGQVIDYGTGASQVHVVPAARYFDYATSDAAVATVSAAGVVTAVAPGNANISAMLGSTAVAGGLTLTVVPVMSPTTPAPTPTLAATNVISLFSDAYTNRTVDSWLTSWSPGTNQLTELMIGTDNVKKYTPQPYLGIEFVGANAIDATTMTHFHIDVWTADASELHVKLVNFADMGNYGDGSMVTGSELNVATYGALSTGTWHSYDIPLADFLAVSGGLAAKNYLAQLLLVTPNNGSVFVDNIYFHN